MKVSAQYKIKNAIPEKTPQQRKEHSKRQFLELQDKRYQEGKEPLDPNLYMQEYKFDYDSYFAAPIFTDAQKAERSAMVQEIKDLTGGWGII